MKFLKYIFFILCLSTLIKAELLKSFKLQNGQTCTDALLQYLNNEQNDIIAPSFNLQYNKKQDVMGGYALICEKNRNAHLFYICKTGNFDSEYSFIMNYLFDKYHDQAITILQNDKKTQKQSNFLVKSTIHRRYTFENDDELCIYTLKSPCAVCSTMYDKLAKTFPNMKINVFYTGLFKYYDISVLKKDYVKNTFPYKICNHQIMNKLVGLDDRKEARLKEKDLLEKGPGMLNCINNQVLTFVQSGGKNLHFFQITIHEEYLNYLLSIMNLVGS